MNKNIYFFTPKNVINYVSYARIIAIIMHDCAVDCIFKTAIQT